MTVVKVSTIRLITSADIAYAGQALKRLVAAGTQSLDAIVDLTQRGKDERRSFDAFGAEPDITQGLHQHGFTSRGRVRRSTRTGVSIWASGASCKIAVAR